MFTKYNLPRVCWAWSKAGEKSIELLLLEEVVLFPFEVLTSSTCTSASWPLVVFEWNGEVAASATCNKLLVLPSSILSTWGNSELFANLF